MVWTVTPVKYGALDPIPGAILGWQPPDSPAFRLPSLGYLIASVDSSRSFLVDLGPSAPRVARKHGRTVVDEGEWLGPASGLRAIGVDPAQIEAVIVTHAHWDHSYGAEELPGSEIILQRAELEYAHDESGAQTRFFDPVGGMFALDRELTVVEGDVEIAEGISCLLVGGHTPGSQVVLIDTADGTVACIGDLCHRYENILGLEIGEAARPSGLMFDESQWADALERLASMEVIPLLAHDDRSRLVLSHHAKLQGHKNHYRIRADDWELTPSTSNLAANFTHDIR